MPVGNILIAQNAVSQGSNLIINNATNTFPLLSVPAYHNMSVVFSVSDINLDESHELSLHIKTPKKEKRIFLKAIPAAQGNVNLPDGMIPSINGVINLGKVQIDEFGLVNVILKLDGEELSSASIVFSHGKAEK